MGNISVKWKILFLALAGPVVVATVMAWQRISDMRQDAVEAAVLRSRALVLMAEATREEMSRKLALGIIKPLEDLPSETVLEAVPVVTAMRTAALKAKEAGYQLRVPKFSPRNPDNTPTELEAGILRELEATGEPEKILVSRDLIRYFRPIRLTQECLFCHGDPKGEPDAVGGIKEGWKVGELHGAFEIISSLDETNARVARAELNIAIVTVGILLAIFVVVSLLLNRSIIRPLLHIREFAIEVARGKLDAVPKGSFSAELDTVKTSIEAMVTNLKDKMHEAEHKSEEAASEARRAEDALAEAQLQQNKSAALMHTMKHAARSAVDIANKVSIATEALSAQVTEVSMGMGQQSSRTSETATAMEEMNSTVLEVARSAEQSAASAEKARQQAVSGAQVVKEAIAAIGRVHKQTQELKEEMSTLGHQTDDIHRVLDVISDIADQTNLLALNAAIEAARAGDAGRGFAVVADEVRKLAEKTMHATKEVGQAIHSIQESAQINIRSMDEAAQSVEQATTKASSSDKALEDIVNLSEETSDQVRAIATAAEEQSATSEEINRAVDDIRRIAQETAEGMQQAATAVSSLAELTRQLEALIAELDQTEGATR